jgi:hypothetical protein
VKQPDAGDLPAEPEAPRGVHILRADGSVLWPELVYRGVRCGRHCWEVAGAVLHPGKDYLMHGTLPDGCDVDANWVQT